MRKTYFCILLSILFGFSPQALAAPRGLWDLKSALEPYVGSHKRPFYIIYGNKQVGGQSLVDFGFRTAWGPYRAEARLKNGEFIAVSNILTPQSLIVSPALQSALESFQPAPLTVTGIIKAPSPQDRDRLLVAFERQYDEEHAPDRFLVSVSGDKVERYSPTQKDEEELKPLALQMAGFQARALALRYDRLTQAARDRGEDFAGPTGPMARLEVELRLARSNPKDLLEENPETSALGFYPPSDVAQYSLPSVLGDNAIFVTFTQDGSYRLEDFN